MSRNDYLSAAIDTLTPDDVRHLIIGEDELQRSNKYVPYVNTYPCTNNVVPHPGNIVQWGPIHVTIWL